MLDFEALSGQYAGALFGDVIPFWQKFSPDLEYGGYFTCLARDGSVYDEDKFVWLQARQLWTFSMLYNQVERRDDWLEMARLGAEFLLRHGMDGEGCWYFSLDRKGRPLVQPYNLFSDCFAAMGLAQYAVASGSDQAAAVATATYRNIIERKDHPKGRYEKAVPGTRPLRSLALPMILSNLALELEMLLEREEVERRLDECVSDLTGPFADPETGLLFEHIAPDGSKVDSFDGRLINPGHTIEAMWFLLDIARHRGSHDLVDSSVETIIRTLDFGWDVEQGGVYYFRDVRGHPPQQLEWDQKLWWVHLESLVALAMAYRDTLRPDALAWLERLHDYTWARFPDPEFGEWFGYLNRGGAPLLTLKGGKWKGCFHVPRALLRCAREFGAIAETGSDATP
jgi:N-acylglucosamine 2-epimerase